MSRIQLCLASLLLLALSACGSPAKPEPTPSTSRTYLAAQIEHFLVQYIWLELPERVQPGMQSVRVFMATTNPPKMMVPTMIDLPCVLASPDDSLEFGPAPRCVTNSTALRLKE
ncbi:MAG: hypothetical protein HY782_15670 [Chloroflexi bacterium]|nr:hypothetical protein [Chloroflexota bacterium]